MKKRQRISLFLLALVVVGGVGLVGWFNLTARRVSAAWFDDNYAYRQTVAITNSGSAQTDFQVSFTLDTATYITAGKMQSDCDDVRVTDVAGKVLPHVIEEGSAPCNNASTKIWVKVPSIPTSGVTLFVYYGNPQATSIEDGTKVFGFFDNFNTNLLNPSKWAATDGYSFSGGALTITTGSVYTPTTILDSSTAYMYEYRAKWDSTVVSYAGLMINNTTSAAGNNTEGDKLIYIMSNGANSLAQRGWANDTSTGYNLANNMTLYTSSAATYYVDGFSMDSSEIKFWNNGSQTGTTATGTWTGAPAPYLWLGLFQGSTSSTTDITDITIDWVRARKYASTAPSTSVSSEEKSVGPVGFWRLDDGQGASVKDSSANNQVGTITNATWQREDQCVSGKCLYFDGSGDNVSMGNVLDNAGTSPVTISAWIRFASDGTHHVIAGKENDSFTGYMLYTGDDTENLRFVFRDASANQIYTDTNTLDVVDNQWHYVVGTYDGSSSSYGMKLYVDGIDRTNYPVGAGSIPGSTSTTANFEIGERASASSHLTALGFIDEVKIYNYVRTAAQVKLDFLNSGISDGVGTKLGSDPRNAYKSLSSGLVGYWKLNESSGTRADSSGDAYTLSDWNTVTSNPGKFGNAGQFTRANSESLYVADNANLSMTGDYTVSGWFYQDTATTGDRCIICKADVINSKREFYLLRATGGPLQFYVSYDGTNSTSVTSSEFSNTASVWNFVVVWYDSTKKTINIQVNGGKVDSADFSQTPYDSDSQFMIGGTGNTAGTVLSFFDGRIDDVRVYKRVLTEADRQLLYNFAPGPVGYWNLEEGSGVTNYDSGEGANSLTMTSNPVFKSGKYGKALQFDGSTNYSAVAAAPTTLVTTWTLEAWINPASLSQLALAVYNGNDAGGYGFGVGNGLGGSGSKLQILFGAVDWVDPNYTFPSANSWYHVAVVRDGTTTTAYINGIRAPNTTTLTPGTVNAKFSVGMQYNSSNVATRFFNGLVDEVKIYNYARTARQILEDLNGSHPSAGSPVGSQLAYFKFDEGQGTTTKSSVGTMSGTLTSMASPASVGISGWNPNGKLGRAISFDGVDDYVSLDTGAGMMPYSSTDVSVSAWVNANAFVASGAVLVYGGDNTNKGWALRFGSNGNAGFTLFCSNSTFPSASDTVTRSLGTWYHIVGTYDHNNLKMYVNGQLTASVSTTCTPFSDTTLRVGQDPARSRYFSGQIDDVKIYNYALSPAEVLVDYNQNQVIKFGSLGVSTTDAKTASDSAASAYCVPGDTTSCAPPVAYWKFDEGSGNAYDSSGNDNTLTNTNGAPYLSGKFGKGAEMRSASTQYFTRTDTSSLSSGDISITWQIWNYLESTSADRPLIYKFNTGATVGEYSQRFAANSYYQCFIKQSSDSVSKSANATNFGVPALKTWHMITCVYDSSADTLKIYIDGVLDTTTTGVTGPADTTADLFIGQIASVDYMDGRVDEAKIYKYARTPAQIAWDYNRGLPMSWWKMDECQASTLYDSVGTASATLQLGASGQTSVGTCNSSANTPRYDGRSGRFNSGIELDGTDDYADLANGSIDPVTTGDFSVGLWLKTTSSSSEHHMFGRGGGGGSTSFVFRMQSGVVNARISNGNQVTDIATSNDGNWHHFVYTANRSGRGTLYRDGQKVASQDISAVSGNSISGFRWVIGGQIWNAPPETINATFDGKLDDIKLWKYALTDYQVRLEYNQSAAVRFGPTSGSP